MVLNLTIYESFIFILYALYETFYKFIYYKTRLYLFNFLNQFQNVYKSHKILIARMYLIKIIYIASSNLKFIEYSAIY